MASYRHFPNKQALLGAVAASGFNRLYLAMKNDGQNQPANMQLLAVGVAYINFAIKNPSLYRLMFGTPNIIRSNFPELIEARDKSYQCCFDAVISTSGTNDELAQKQALSLWALVHGYSSMMIDGAIEYPKRNPSALKDFIVEKLTIPMPENKK